MINESFDSTIDEMLEEIISTVIPENQKTDFDDGILSLVDISTFEVMKYYNDLLKLKLLNNEVNAALLTKVETRELPIEDTFFGESGATAMMVLDSNDFVDQGFERPVTDFEYSYKFHTIKQDDSLSSIAYEYYGDSAMWPKIAQINKLQQNDLIDSDMIGQIIKIPVNENQGLVKGDENLVYQPTYDLSSIKSIQTFLYGTDIFLEQKGLIVDNSGDLKIMSGLDCVVANILDRVNVKNGDLPTIPDFGIFTLNEYKNIPFFVKLEKFCAGIEDQIMLDPRAVNASCNREEVVIKTDTIYLNIDIELIGGYSELIEVKYV